MSQTEQIAVVVAHYNHGMNFDKRWATFGNVRLLLRTLTIGVSACVMLILTYASLAAQTPVFKVLVLDALDGKPQSNVKVEPLCVGLPLNFLEKAAFTNDMGIATVSYACRENQKIEIAVFPPNKKEQCGGDAGMTFSDVVSAGFLSRPDSDGGIWCPAKVSQQLKPVQGQATIFVKKPTWWQSHVAG